MNDTPPTASRLLRAFAGMTRVALWLLIGLWLLLALWWGSLHWIIVPRIDQWRGALEQQATRALGQTVRIGSIAAETTGLVPSFELRNLALLDREGRQALLLPRVVVALSPRSLWRLGFEQLYIDRPELDIRRSADGRLWIAGLDFARGGDTDGQGARWFFRQTEFVIRGGTLRWTDELRAAPPLALSDVDLLVRNGGRRHQGRLDATPPAEFGGRFSLRAQFREPLLSFEAGRWQDWEGQVYAHFPSVDLARLAQQVDLGIQARAGEGALRLWADAARGEFLGAVADLQMQGVEAVLGERLQPLALQTVSGRLGGRRLANGFEVRTEELQFRTREGQVWPGGNAALTWTGAEGRVLEQGDFRADRLDLGALAQIATRLPLDDAARERIADFAPRGQVDALQLRWQGPLSAPQSYEGRGKVRDLVLAAGVPVPQAGVANAPGRPGVRGAAVEFDFTHSGGKARLGIERGALDLPGMFEQPRIDLQRLRGDLQWQIDGEQLSVQVQDLSFANADVEGQAQGRWRTSDPATSPGKGRFPGILDVQGTLSRGDAARVHRYLPQAIAKGARDYVRDAVQRGTLSAVKFRVQGDLWDLPFADPARGEFRIAGQLRNATYAYVPRSLQDRTELPWPAFTDLSGELVFDRIGMQVRGAEARVAGFGALQLQKVQARIDDLTDRSTLEVRGELRGPLQDALAVVRGSPISGFTSRVLDQTSASGSGEIRLALTLPLYALNQSKVQGAVVLNGNDLRIAPDTPLLGRARGTVNFSESGFSLAGAQARLLGGDARIEGGSRVVAAGSFEPGVVLRAQGVASADGLRQASELGLVSRLAQYARGSTGYSATLAFRRGQPELSVSSALQGLAVTLPAPLGKPAEATLPLRFDTALLRESWPAGSRPVDQLSVEVGRLLRLQYLRDVGGASARVLRGAIEVGLSPGESAPMPEQGVRANLQFGEVDIDAWEKVLDAVGGAEAPLPPGVPAAAGSSASSGASGAPRPGAAAAPREPPDYLPTVLALRARSLTLEGRQIRNVVAGGSREARVWRANLDADELSGYLEYREGNPGTPGRVLARLARLSLAASASNAVETLLTEPPATVPALDVVVDQFDLRGRALGRLEIDAVNRTLGGARDRAHEWRLNRLALGVPEATFSASGSWLPAGSAGGAGSAAGARANMNFRLDVADSGALLARFGMKDVVRGGEGRLDGEVSWRGSPLTIDYPSLNGQINVNMSSGQFLKAEPGIAKLLGVLSLQSLPRRLVLDFRDVFTEGFAFDFVRGDVRIAQGIASTNNLQMKGVNAAVLMEGSADIARETQDLRVVVVPEINAGTASLVAAAINPVVGLGSFLAQLFLRDPLMRAATQEFRIDGTWTEPRVARVDRGAQRNPEAPAAGPRAP